MKKPIAPLLVSAILCAWSLSATAEQVVATYKGTYSRSTPEFEVRAPWILDWRVTTEGAHDSAVDVSLESAGLGVHQGRVLMTKDAGNGVRLFRRSGRFYFRVDSSFANWTLKVVELTEEEAAEYTPVESDDSRR